MSPPPRRTMTVSQERFERAQSHLAGGVGSGTRSPRAGWRPCPISVAEASGSQIIDADGNRYVDYQMGQGPLILGHRPPALIEALTQALASHGSQLANQGFCLGIAFDGDDHVDVTCEPNLGAHRNGEAPHQRVALAQPLELLHQCDERDLRRGDGPLSHVHRLGPSSYAIFR